MAGVSPGGSPTSFTRTLEKVFEEAQHTGEINLCSRKLKEYPKVAAKYDLEDTTVTDISKNRFSEIPVDVCQYSSTEKLICHHNVIKNIPQALVQLQSLVKLNLSRNQLSTIPPFICQLQSLEVLLASNNRLVSLPEEIGRLEKLMELDVSCNEITHLPSQMGDMESLRDLDVRRNLLVELPQELSRLRLHRLDISENRISGVPRDLRRMETLQEIVMDSNPLLFPPASICTRGRIHVMKYLHTEALKEDRKRGVMSESDHRRNYNKSLHPSASDEFRNYLESPGERRKRHTVDSGYSTTDSTTDVRLRWSPSEVNSADIDEANNLALKAAESVKEQRQSRDLELQRRLNARNASDTISITSSQSLPVATTQNGYIGNHSNNTSPFGSHGHHPHFGNHIQTSPLATVGSSPQMAQSLSSSSLQSSSQPHTPSPMSTGSSSLSPGQPTTPGSITSSSGAVTSPSPHMTSPSPHMTSPRVTPGSAGSSASPVGVAVAAAAVDPFKQELQRQKAEYEAKKKMAERLRREVEEGERQKAVTQEIVEEEREREERRRAALRLQEEQTAILEQQKEEARRKSEQNSLNSSFSSTGSPQYNSYHDNPPNNRRVTQSQSFKEDKRVYGAPQSGGAPYRRTVSESQYSAHHHDNNTPPAGRDNNHSPNWARNNGISEHSMHREAHEPNHNLPPDEEFRLRQEAMNDHRRRETQRIRKCIEEEKIRLKQIHGNQHSNQHGNQHGNQHSNQHGNEGGNHDDKGRHVRQIQKDAVYSYYSKRTVYSSGKALEDEEAGFSFSRDSTPNTSFNSSTMPNMKNRSTLPVAVQRGLEEMRDNLDNMNPAFTIRRQFQHAQEEMEMIEQLRMNIEGRLKVKLPDDLPAALKDGVVLCHLANHIRPRSVSSIHVPSPAVPKLSMAKCRRNVENFLEACRRMGVEQEHICPVSCVLEEKGTPQLAVTVDVLLNNAGAPKVAMV